MPKRSNKFQQLVFLIKKHTIGNAIVTESKLLIDRITGVEREVDIYIEINHPASDRLINISLECTDSKRKCDIKWVEGMKTKHDGLPTDILFLVSKNGFSKNAQILAQKYGIVLTTLRQVSSDKGIQALNLKSLNLSYFEMSPINVFVKPIDPEGKDAEEIVLQPEDLIFSQDNEEMGKVKEIILFLINLVPLKREIASHGKPSHAGVELCWEDPMWKGVSPICVRKEGLAHHLPVKHFRIKCTLTFSSSPLSFEHGSFGKTKVAWSEPILGEKPVLLVATETEAGEVQFALSFKGSEFPRLDHASGGKLGDIQRISHDVQLP